MGPKVDLIVVLFVGDWHRSEEARGFIEREGTARCVPELKKLTTSGDDRTRTWAAETWKAVDAKSFDRVAVAMAAIKNSGHWGPPEEHLQTLADAKPDERRKEVNELLWPHMDKRPSATLIATLIRWQTDDTLERLVKRAEDRGNFFAPRQSIISGMGASKNHKAWMLLVDMIDRAERGEGEALVAALGRAGSICEMQAIELLKNPSLSRDKKFALTLVLGEVGTKESISALSGVLRSNTDKDFAKAVRTASESIQARSRATGAVVKADPDAGEDPGWATPVRDIASLRAPAKREAPAVRETPVPRDSPPAREAAAKPEAPVVREGTATPAAPVLAPPPAPVEKKATAIDEGEVWSKAVEALKGNPPYDAATIATLRLVKLTDIQKATISPLLMAALEKQPDNDAISTALAPWIPLALVPRAAELVMKNENAALRRQFMPLIGQTEDPRVLTFLLSQLDGTYSAEAVAGLRKMGEMAEAPTLALLKQPETSKEKRIMLITVLGDVGGKESANFLATLIKSPSVADREYAKPARASYDAIMARSRGVPGKK